MFESKRPRFGGAWSCAIDFDRVALPSGDEQDGLSVRRKSRRADISTPKCDLVILRVRYLNPPKLLPGDQPGSRSQQKTETRPRRRKFIRSRARQYGVATLNGDRRLGGSIDPRVGGIRVALQSLEISSKLRRGLAS